METIYDELDNFEHIIADEKIREEVIKLRVTVKEQEDEIDRLKEANRTMSETLEKIQTNFNSLLKTARAEVERKTEMINTLNAEKDQLIFRQIGNRNTPLRKMLNRKNLKNSSDETSSEITKVTKRKMESSPSEENKRPKLESHSASSNQSNDKNVGLEVFEIDNQFNLDQDMSANLKTTKSLVENRVEASSIRVNSPSINSDAKSEATSDLPNQSEDKSSSKILNTLFKRIEEEKISSQLSSVNPYEEVNKFDKFISVNRNSKKCTEKKNPLGNKAESSIELGKEDLRYRIPLLKSKEDRGTRKDEGNNIDKRERNLRDTRQEEEESIREKDSRKRKEIPYTDKKIDSRYNKKEEKFQGRKTDEHYQNYKRMHEKQIGSRKSSRESDEHCENSRIEKTDHHRFSRSKYRDEAKYRYRQSKSCYGYDRYDRSSRLRSPRTRGRTSRNIRGGHSAYHRLTERFVSPSYKRRTSMDRRSSGYNREGSRNSSCEGSLEKYDTDNDMKLQGDIKSKRKDSISTGTKVSSSAFTGEGCIDIDTAPKHRPAIKLRNKDKNDVSCASEIQLQESVSEPTRETVDVYYQTSEQSKHTMDNILNIETRMCQSPDDVELAVKIAQPETYIKLSKETGTLDVFDDPRLYSIKYFNEDDIARNKVMKSGDSKQLSDTDIKFRIKTTDICLKTVMYVEGTQKPEICKTSTISEEFLKTIYTDVDAQFSDSSQESGELDDSLYFDRKCDQIKPVLEIKLSALSPIEPTEKTYNSANTSRLQSPREVDPSRCHRKDASTMNLQRYKIPKISKTQSCIENYSKTSFEDINYEDTKKDPKHKNILQNINKEETVHSSDSGSESKKYSEFNVINNCPDNYQQLGSLLRNHLENKSEAKLSYYPQYEHKGTPNPLIKKPKKCDKSLLKKRSEKISEAKDCDCQQYEHIETAKILKSNPENSEESLLKNPSEKKSESILSHFPQSEHKETLFILTRKHIISEDEDNEKRGNDFNQLVKNKEKYVIRPDDSPKEIFTETETCLELDSKNKGFQNEPRQKDKGIKIHLDESCAGDKLFTIASETGIDTQNELSYLKSNSSLTPDSLDHKKINDIIHDRSKQEKPLFDNLDQQKNNDSCQIGKHVLEKDKITLIFKRKDARSQKNLKEKETDNRKTELRKTDTKAYHPSKNKHSSSFSRYSKPESSCRDRKKENKQKTLMHPKSDKQLQNIFGIENKRHNPEVTIDPSTNNKEVGPLHTYLTDVGIENKRHNPEVIIDPSTNNKEVSPLHTSPTDERHGHKIMEVSKKTNATLKIVSKSKKETINEKITDLFGENSLITTEDLIGRPVGLKIVNQFEEDFHLLNTFKGCNDLTVYEGTVKDVESKTIVGNTIKEVDTSQNKTDNILKCDDDQTIPVVIPNLKNKEILLIGDVNKTISTDEKTKLCRNIPPRHNIKVDIDKTVKPNQQCQDSTIQDQDQALKDVSTSPNVIQLSNSKRALNSLILREGYKQTVRPSNTKKGLLKQKVDDDRGILIDITKNSEKYDKEYCVDNKFNYTDNTSTEFKSLPMLGVDIEEEITLKEKSKEMLANLQNVNSKNDKIVNDTIHTKETKQTCNPSNLKLNCNQTALRALSKNIESVTPTDSDGEPTNTIFVTSTPNPNVSPQPNHKRDFCIQSPIKECSIENPTQIHSITVPNELCVQSNNVSQSTHSHVISQSSVTAPRFIIGRRRRVIVKS